MKLPELLAPVGGVKQLKAAVENGADAVYLGGPLFNARAGAENFGRDAMSEAMEYAHLRGVKVYVTMNTLVRDAEMEEALDACETYCRIGADALIVQDMGLVGELRRFLPDLPLHLSTQGTVYDLAGVLAAREMGFSRVIPAREVGLKELVEICSHPGAPEIEVFVHGALCMSYSGQCHLSREIGGRSGNRGACAQPCRLPYQVTEPGSYEKGRQTFPLSPRDLCLLDYLGDLTMAGVASLKIEGRMKSPAYVAVVTGIYRKYLDQYKEKGFCWIEEVDRKALRQIFSRGSFTTGYFLGDPGRELISGDLSKHRGLPAGVVTGRDPKRRLVDIAVEGDLALGDGIEIYRKRVGVEADKKLPGNVITFFKEKGVRGEKRILTVGYLEGDIKAGDLVFKITEKGLLEKAERSFLGGSWEAEKGLRKVEIGAVMKISTQQSVTLSIWDEDGNRIEKSLGVPAEKALSKPLTKEQVIGQLGKTGGTPFRMADMEIDLEEESMLPLAAINRLRREALEELTALRTAPPRRRIGPRIHAEPAAPPAEGAAGRLSPTPKLAFYFHRTPEALYRDEIPFTDLAKLATSGSPLGFTANSLPVGFPLKAPTRLYLPYGDFLAPEYQDRVREWRAQGLELIPTLPVITKGVHNERIRTYFHQIFEAAKDGISVGNLNWIAPFVEAGAKVYGDYGLNLQNSSAIRVAKEWGLTGAVAAHERIGPEINFSEMKAMNFHGLESELALGGRIPAMITAHCFPEVITPKTAKSPFFELKDRKGECFPVYVDKQNQQSILFSHKEIRKEKNPQPSGWEGFSILRIYT